MKESRKEWASKKIHIALRLYGGECGGSYGESVMILCAVLSALAAEVWPGRRQDKSRFVELLKDFVPVEFNVTRISIPLLVAHLRNKGLNRESETIRKAFLDYPQGDVLIGDDIDKSETDILALCNTLDIKDLRNNSYASLLYGKIRSGYVHEYGTGELSDSWPMTREETSISYVNWACEPDKHIHFHVPWMSKLVLSVAEAVDAVGERLPRPKPKDWWLSPLRKQVSRLQPVAPQ